MPADRPAGRATDAEVAEKVMGWLRVQPGNNILGPPFLEGYPPRGDHSPISDTDEVPFYSTDWSAMQLVVERMAALGYYFELVGRLDGSFMARFRCPETTNAGQLYRNAETAPLAVCDAALSALAAPTEPEA